MRVTSALFPVPNQETRLWPSYSSSLENRGFGYMGIVDGQEIFPLS